MGMSLMDFFDKGVQRDPDRACLVFGEEVRTYAEVQRSSYRIANALVARGIAAGSRIAVLAHNASRPFECVLGALRAGCTWVPVNARNATAETVYVLGHTDAQVLFYSSVFNDQLAQLLSHCPRISQAVCIDGPSSGNGASLDEWLEGIGDAPIEVKVPGDALASLACSGGTTGLPKGVMTSHRTWAYRIAEAMIRLAHPRPVHLVAAPMTHGAGTGALELMALGATHVVLPGFDAGAVLEAIARHGVTHVFLPPTALYRVLAHPALRSGDYSSLRYLMCGGAPIAPERLKQALEVFGPAMHVGYGGTEFGGGMCWMTGTMLLEALGRGEESLLLSCGRPSPLVRFEIVDEAGHRVPDGMPGEIAILGDNNATGYYGHPEESARAFRDGWFYSGDIGYRDAQGYLYITDRRKDMIISGGFNIYPSEVERVILQHMAVQDCAVIGVPDEHWGESVKAVIELKVGCSASVADIEALCRSQLAGYKVPRSVEIWEEIPRSPVGKVLKRAVRERYWQGQARAV
jgi:acyl-CoA synthetase (AMP-forming)/AMP-acid ligase II